MNWLMNNQIADMYGPYFLILFAILGVGAVFFAWQNRRLNEPNKPPLQVPDRINPYQIGYLRGGIHEVIRIATCELIANGWIRQTLASSPKSKKDPIEFVAVEPAPSIPLNDPVLKIVYEHFRIPQSPESIFSSRVPELLVDHTEGLSRWAESESLKPSATDRFNITLGTVFLIVALTVFATYKLTVALAKGHYNILFLIGILIVATIAVMIVGLPRRLTKRGREFLRDVQTTYRPLLHHKNWNTAGSHSTDNPTFASGASQSPDIALASMGIFGVMALNGSEFDPVYQAYRRSTLNSSSCGAATSAASCGSSCGSSCGGGGAGAGCGGGGGGGGGCGGCGGGGCGGS